MGRAILERVCGRKVGSLGITREIYATSSTYTDTTFGLITALGVIHSGSGYLVVLGKLLRGSSVTGSSTPGGSTPAAESALFDSFEFMVNIIKIGGCF